MKQSSLIFLFLTLTHALLAQTLNNISSNELNLSSEPGNGSAVLASIWPNSKLTAVDNSNCKWPEEQYGAPIGNNSSKNLSEEGNKGNNPDRDSCNNNRSSSQYKRNSSSASARYNTGLGFRFGGWDSGLTIKHFIKNNAAFEGILSFGWHSYRGTRITGLYEIQKTILGATGLSWFYGAGAHVAFYKYNNWGDCKNGYYEHKGKWYPCDDTRTSIGIDGIIGLEYHFRKIPFTIGLDFKPSINIIGWGGHIDDGAFTVRYAF